MALRLRRGTNAERLLITPLEGELIYTTDTKKLYVGDGITIGGNPIDTAANGLIDLSQSSINDLADVNTDSSTPTDGALLIYDSTSGDWVAGSSPLGNLLDVDLISTPPSDGSVLAYDNVSQQWVPASPLGSTATLGGLVNVSPAADSASTLDFLTYSYEFNEWGPLDITDLTFKINIRGNDSSVIVDTDNNQFNGDVNGNVTGTLSGNVIGTITAADGVNIVLDNGTDGSDAIFRGDVVGDLTGNVVGDLTGNINATGTLDGDLSGSVFADDSTLIVDSINKKVFADIEGGNIVATSVFSNSLESSDIRMGGITTNLISTINPATASLNITTENTNGEIISNRPFRIGGVSAGYSNGSLTIFNNTALSNAINIVNNVEDINGTAISISKSRGTKAVPAPVQTGDILGAFVTAGYNGAGYARGGGIDVQSTGTPAANKIPSKINLFTFNTSGIPQTRFSVDDVGTATFTGPAQLAVYADPTARDTAIPSPTAGMMIFLTDSTGLGGAPKAQVNTDGTTLGWVDLH